MSERLLPANIRFALHHGTAQLGRHDVEELYRNGFDREALYLMLKVESATPDRHLSLLRALAAIFSGEDGDPEGTLLRSFIHSHLQTMQAGVFVKGGKLAQLSRQGFDLWYEKYRSTAERYAAAERQLFIVGNATFIGLPDFIRLFAAEEKPLHIIMPAFIRTPHERVCGYRIYNGDAEFLEKTFPRPPRAVLLDDVRKTGKTTVDIIRFWRAAGATEPDIRYLDVPKIWAIRPAVALSAMVPKKPFAYARTLFKGFRPKRADRSSLLGIPPESVRYALQYQGARMGKSHMKELGDSGYPDVAIYLYAKTLSGNALGLETFLNRYILSRFGSSAAAFIILQNAIADLDPNVNVNGAKLGQLFRQGIELWRERYAETAKRFAQKRPIYILSTPLVGLDAILDASEGAGNVPFGLTRVDWHNEPNCLYQGYEVNLKNRDHPVLLLPKTSLPPRDGTIIDDTHRGEESDFERAFVYLEQEKRPTNTYAIDRAPTSASERR